MAGSVLIDTSVLICATGVDGSEKGLRAAAVLRNIEAGNAGRLSTQVLSEYANTMLRRLPRPAHPDVARAVARLCATWPQLTVTETTVVEAIRGTIEHGMSFYDAQIWATARLAGIDVVLTEDFTDGRLVEGVRFVDPFSPSFDPRQLSI